MEKLTKSEIDSKYIPYCECEARKHIGQYIKKRPGVFNDDTGRVYKILGCTNVGFIFWDKDIYHGMYRYENIIYDYVFENGNIIGIKR